MEEDIFYMWLKLTNGDLVKITYSKSGMVYDVIIENYDSSYNIKELYTTISSFLFFSIPAQYSKYTNRHYKYGIGFSHGYLEFAFLKFEEGYLDIHYLYYING